MSEKTSYYDAEAIRAAMARKRISVRELAKVASVSHPTITKARAGRDIYISNLKAICEALELTFTIRDVAHPASNQAYRQSL